MSQDNNQSLKVKVPEDGLGARVRQAREAKGLTQEALSILTRYPEIDPEGRGLSRPSIIGYEQGKSLPDARGLRLLAEALEVSPSWLILGKYDTPDDSKEDPRKTLIDALDRYTARREIELSHGRPKPPDPLDDFMKSFEKVGEAISLEPLDWQKRKQLEEKAGEEAKLETQRRNKTI